MSCPNCGTEIFEKRGDLILGVLGNYRSIQFFMKDGSKMSTRCCLECHDGYEESWNEAFHGKLVQEWEKFIPTDWDETKKSEFRRKIRENTIVGVAKKEGPLCKGGLEQARIALWDKGVGQ